MVQVVSDFDLLRGPEHFYAEFDLVEAMARASGSLVGPSAATLHSAPVGSSGT